MIDLSRRAFLAATAAAATAACSAPLPGLGAEDPDDTARRLSAESERELIAAYEGFLAGSPALANRLTPILEQHRAHLQALDPEATGSGGSASPAAPRSQASLRRMESEAARQRTTAATTVSDEALVTLLARIAASESQHATYLAGGGR